MQLTLTDVQAQLTSADRSATIETDYEAAVAKAKILTAAHARQADIVAAVIDVVRQEKKNFLY